MDKEHKKLMNGVRSICEALELMGEDITERIAKSENRLMSQLDGRMSRDLRAVTAVQTELLAKLDRLERAQRQILDRLPEVDEVEGLRRRIRYLERAVQDLLIAHDETPPDPAAHVVSAREAPGPAARAEWPRSDQGAPRHVRVERAAFDAPQHIRVEPEQLARADALRPDRPEPPRLER